MASSQRTARSPQSPHATGARARANGRAPARPVLTDAAKLARPPVGRSAATRLGPHLYRLPVSSGVWAMSTDESPDAPLPRGLYQQERGGEDEEPRWSHRSELPYVHVRIVRRDGSDRRLTTDYLLSGAKDGPRVPVSARVVRSGDWAGAVGLDPAADRKVIDAAATAIFRMRPLIGDFAGEREAVPRIGPDGKVTVPVAESLPTGYFRTGSLSRPEALALWREVIVPVAVANPKMALVLGASAVSPFVGWLDYSDVRAFIVDLAGKPNGGKSTAVRTAGAIWGAVPKDGNGVVGSWNLSNQGPGRVLGMLGILAAIFDEQGVSGYTPDQWARIILSITDGSRRAADRESGLRVTLPYSGVVISAGNASIMAGLGAGKYAGIGPKRVNTLDGPFTGSAEQAESVKPVLRDAHGHPGQVIVESFTAAGVLALVRDAAGLIGFPSGVMARSASKNMHLMTAGAAMLDRVLGTGTVLRDAAAVAAREYLEANGHDPEHDADRLLTAIRDCMASQPARWPTRAEYRDWKLPRPEYGEHGEIAPGRIELPQHRVDRDIAGVWADDRSWFAVAGPALDELLTKAGADRSTALMEADKRGWLHRTATDRTSNNLGTKILHIPGRLYRFDLPADDDGQAPAELPAPSAEPESESPRPEPATADPGRCPGCEHALPLHALDCPDLPPLPPEPDEDEDEAREPGRAETAVAAFAPVPDPEAPEPDGSPFTGAVRAYLADCAGSPVPLDRKYHPTADGAVKAIVHHGRAEADMIRAAFTLAVGVAIPEPVPAGGEAELDKAGREGQAPEPEPRQMPADADELAAFTRAMRKVDADATDDDLTAALATFHTATGGVRWVSYAGQVGQAWFAMLAAQHPSMRTPDPLASPRVREVAESGPRTRVNYTARPRGPIRSAGRFVTSYDLNGQHAAAAGSAELGDGEPEVIESPREITGLTRFPGYVRLAKDLRTGHPAFGTLAAGEWVAMPLIGFLIRDLGLTVPAAEVIYWPKHGRRLSVYVSRYRDARDKLMRAGQTEPVRLALAALKSQANAFVGMFHSETYSHGGFYRPDWYDMIVATAEANALRSLAKCPVSPVAKMADSAYWIADHEPYEPEGLEITAQLGKWKIDRHGPVSAGLIAALKDGPAAVRDAVIQIDAERRAAL